MLEIHEPAAAHARLADRTQVEVRADASDFPRYRIRFLAAVKIPTKEGMEFFTGDLRVVGEKDLQISPSPSSSSAIYP